MNTKRKRTISLLTIIVLAITAFIPPTTAAYPAIDAGLQQFNLSATKTVNLARAAPGDTLEYTIQLVNETPDVVPALVDDPIPSVLDFVLGSEWASAGTVVFQDGSIHWDGDILPGGEVEIGFAATVSRLAIAGQPITNTASIIDGSGGGMEQRSATTIAETSFTGYDNTGKTAIDSMCEMGAGCGARECLEYECSDECES